MTWVRRGRLLVGVLLVCLSIPLLGGQAAWAGTVTDTYGGWGFYVGGSWTLPQEQTAGQDFLLDRPAKGAYDFSYTPYQVCGNADGSGTQAITARSTVSSWSAGTTLVSTTACTSPQVLMAFWVAVHSERGTSLVARWAGTANPSRGTYNTGVVASPSPSPVYVVSPSPSPVSVPGPTYYAYPSPQAGGGDVDSCASDTCTVTLAAGTTVGLSDEQALALWLFLGTLLLLALTGFLLRHGRALRV